MKRILIISLAALLMGNVSVMAEKSNSIEIVDNDFQNISISVNESTLRVVGASGQVLYIYNVAGVRVMSIKVEISVTSLTFPKDATSSRLARR